MAEFDTSLDMRTYREMNPVPAHVVIEQAALERLLSGLREIVMELEGFNDS